MTDGFVLSREDHAAVVEALERWRDAVAELRATFADFGGGKALVGAEVALADAERALEIVRRAREVPAP